MTAISIYSQSFSQKSAERNSQKKYLLYLFWYLAWGSNPGFTSNKPTHYLLDCGDFLFPFRKTQWGFRYLYFYILYYLSCTVDKYSCITVQYTLILNSQNGNLYSHGCNGSFKYLFFLENALKKLLNIFSNFFFLFESTILTVNNGK